MFYSEIQDTFTSDQTDGVRQGLDHLSYEIREQVSDGLPPEALDLAPGLELHSLLASLERSNLTGYDLVNLLKAQYRLAAHFQSQALETIAVLSHRSDSEFGTSDEPFEFVANEVATALHMTRRAAESQVALALQLDQTYRGVRDAISTGAIDLWRARVLIEATFHLRSPDAVAVIETVLPVASDLTAGQLKARTTRICMEMFPEAAAKALEVAHEQRRVLVNGQNVVGQNLDPIDLVAIRSRLNRLARRARAKGDTRTADQRRADVFVDLLLGRIDDTGVTAHVDIVADLSTLTGLSETPGHLPGWGPITAEMTRNLATASNVSRMTGTVTENGEVLATDLLRRRPTVQQTRDVTAAHTTCVFPGCRMPARESDIDHMRAHSEGGPTIPDNLSPLCRHHHRVRHLTAWTYRRTGPGEHTWTSPMGHTYIVDSRGPPAN